MTVFHCCFLENNVKPCPKPAEFDIRGIDRYHATQACADHVGHLLGTPVDADYTDTYWTVSQIAP